MRAFDHAPTDETEGTFTLCGRKRDDQGATEGTIEVNLFAIEAGEK